MGRLGTAAGWHPSLKACNDEPTSAHKQTRADERAARFRHYYRRWHPSVPFIGIRVVARTLARNYQTENSLKMPYYPSGPKATRQIVQTKETRPSHGYRIVRAGGGYNRHSCYCCCYDSSPLSRFSILGQVSWMPVWWGQKAPPPKVQNSVHHVNFHKRNDLRPTQWGFS